ncbi:S1 domain-containing protein/UBA domain-containing protein/EF_TS domain-containing protein [Cephalotus follicularis]|uniref:Elongation factor Ts, mitochondrial n=1 Tax=Cephalotus follicularis TaxID=3775 RepID=A0A1Q3DF75_CEPFO|nr:S1 domain-containing protein/UBA domain-containing protein/EF_TS domain-containing protein [Cephalotus follicularis]
MTPVIPCSLNNISLIPGTDFTVRRNNYLTRCSFSRKSTKHTLSSQKIVLPPSTTLKLFPSYKRVCEIHLKYGIHILSATGTDVVVEEPDSPVVDEESGPHSAVETSEKSSTKSDTSPGPVQSKRTKSVRKSEMPPVKNEELIPGATFTGKVRSIQPFGAFVDFGAFTDGLVHVSRLSDSFVKDVGDIVSVGQEVKVKLVEANTETGRIALTMRESDDATKLQQLEDASANRDKPRPARRNTSNPNPRKGEVKSSKFVKGQDLEGTVKNITRAGAFVSLPEGEEGFLPTSEESDDDGIVNMMGGSSLQVGQEVSVRVLRISRGQVTLTMKKEEDTEKLDSQTIQGVVHVATNPFVLAFRKNMDIASFLDEREKMEKAADKQVILKTSEATVPDIPEVLVQQGSSAEEVHCAPSAVGGIVKDDEASSKETVVGDNIAKNDKYLEDIVSSSSQNVDGAAKSVEKETEETNETLSADGIVPTKIEVIEEADTTDGVESDGKSSSSGEITAQVFSSDSVKGEVTETQSDDAIAKDGMQFKTPSAENEIPPAASYLDGKGGPAPDENGSITSSSVQCVSSPQETKESKAIEEVVENQVDESKDEMQVETPVAESKISSTSQFKEVGTAHEKNGSVNDKDSRTTAISPALVKQLREETGAGMMDCKKALTETGGDIAKAQEFLRKKGLASAEKKASRATAEGRIGSYIHDGRIGVLVEVNCETDFVSRGDIFKELVNDLAMQVAACPQVQYLATEDVPEDTVKKEKEIEMQKEDLLSKPEQIRLKIVEGRIRKRLEELALLEQPYIKNDKMVVKDWVNQTISTIGENIKVKRFVRYNLGEGLEKKSQDFAAEVAAQTVPKSVSAPGKEKSSAEEAKETVQKPQAVTVSATLVKQLRDETGAGMMDCKKALSETGGDLEKAQDYLRKKGLSTADKKSSRLAAEGRIGAYIHDSRIGALIEVNCETDFVGRSEKFKELVADLAMQVVACPQVQFVSVEDIPESIVRKEKELEMQREDLLSKPENIREKIVEGRISKRLGEIALLEQPFIKNDNVMVKDFVKETVAALGENVKVRRFVKFTLGETTEDAKTEN